MRGKEIFAEKIRALMTRKRARDLFDLHFLMSKGVSCGREIIEEKMRCYNEKFDIHQLLSRLRQLEGSWKNELRGFTPLLPEFNAVEKEVSGELRKRYA